jgi:DNA (cytosine-5)-methyltransferase 1
MKTMHLFAGIGGGLLADLILGHEPIVAVEWDSYAGKVLRERAADGWFPGLSVWEGDVRLFDPSEYAGKVDCIHAGFPCQDISVAGKQAGVSEGTRSGLYREVLRIAGIVKPRFLFLENVSAILSNGLGTVLADLAAMGYDSRWICIRASDVGAPHHRDRWFALCTYTGHHESSGRNQPAEGLQHSGGRDARSEPASLCSDVADSMCKRLEGQREITGRTGEELYDISHSCWWESESIMGRVANGIPHRIHRLKGLGNAQVPLQAATAWRLLGGE